MKKKITDKMRLNWLEKNGSLYRWGPYRWSTYYLQGSYKETARQAIDAAMKKAKP